MTSQAASVGRSSTCERKTVGLVALGDLRRPRPHRVSRLANQVLEDGTSPSHPLGRFTDAEAGTTRRGGLGTAGLGSGAGVFLLALLGWCLDSRLYASNVDEERAPAEPVAEATRGEDPARAAQPAGAGEHAKSGQQQPQRPKDQGVDDSTGPTKRPAVVLQLGHFAPINTVAFSHDGKQVLTASVDGTARLWDTVSGLEIRTFQAETVVADAAFSPDGTQIITGHLDGKLARLWNAATGKETRTLPGPNGPGSHVRFSPDGRSVLGTSADYRDHTVRLWDVTSGAEIATFKGHTSGVNALAFSPDGKLVLTGSGDRTTRLWKSSDGNEIHVFRGPEGKGGGFEGDVLSVAFSPDGKLVLTGATDKIARLWDAASGMEIRAFQGHSHYIDAVAFSPDGKQVLTGSTDGTARLWNTANGKEMQVCRGHTGEVLAVAFSPDGTQALTASTDVTARLWDARSGKEIRTFAGHTVLGKVNAVAFSPDGKQVITGSGDQVQQRKKPAGMETNTARLWDVVIGKQVRSTRHKGPVLSVAFSPDGDQVLTRSSNKTTIWEVATGKEMHSLVDPSGARCLGCSPSGLVVLSNQSGAVLWDMISGTKTCDFLYVVDDQNPGVRIYRGAPDPRSVIRSVSIAPDGKHVLTVGSTPKGPSTSLWEASSGKLLRTIGGHIGKSQASHYSADAPMAFSPDGKQFLTGSFNDNNTIRLWDAESGQELRTFKGHMSAVSSVTFSPDGTQVLTGSWDRTARLWNAATGAELRTFHGHTNDVTSVAFSPDGKRVIMGSVDETARIWDTATGEELCRLLGFGDDSTALITPDDYYMATRDALQGVAFSVGNRAYPFEQFDLKFNRPDKVIERIGLAPPELVAAYKQAYQKRLKRMQFTEEMLSDDFHLPEISVSSAVPFETRETTLELKVQARDSKYLLDRLRVDVNGVPIQDAQGISLRKKPAKTWERPVELELTPGRNRIDVSVLNEKGAESLKETFAIQCNAPAGKPDLYVVVVGVSDYQDARFRLTYADKDARDLADLFQSKRDHFGAVKVLRILNRDATRETIKKAREFLEASRVNDPVVLFFAGHGLLDSKLDYYFATADIDFSDPAQRGLPYEAIEDLLDGIRSRKKLLLVDTCHSGELDKEDVQEVRAETKPEGEVKTRTFRGFTRVTSRLGLGNSYQLLQEMFADLRRGTGAVVIASAGGSEYALESASWKNGVFTHAVLRGLEGEADRNRDGHVQVSELRDFVEQEVQRLTAGRQSPTARRENLVVDFTFD